MASEIAAQFTDWSSSLFFDQEKNILYSSVEGITPEQVQGYIDLFNDYDTTIKVGVTFNNLHFHVHRFYDGLIYGRADPNTKKGDGFCLYRTPREGKPNLYVLITYSLPNVSARIIPEMAKKIEEVKNTL